MSNKVYIEDAEELMRISRTYRSILDHRDKCPKWGKEFCLECFGGGLTTFMRDVGKEFIGKEDYKEKAERILREFENLVVMCRSLGKGEYYEPTMLKLKELYQDFAKSGGSE